MLKYSLVGYDSSESSQRAFRLAMQWAKAGHGRVRVVSVLQVLQGGADACALMMTESASQRRQELFEELRIIDPATEQLVDLEVLHGSPGDVLLSQVAQYPIDHI